MGGQLSPLENPGQRAQQKGAGKPAAAGREKNSTLFDRLKLEGPKKSQIVRPIPRKAIQNRGVNAERRLTSSDSPRRVSRVRKSSKKQLREKKGGGRSRVRDFRALLRKRAEPRASEPSRQPSGERPRGQGPSKTSRANRTFLGKRQRTGSNSQT